MTEEIGQQLLEEPPPRWRGSHASVGLTIGVFVLGLIAGVPISMFGIDILIDNSVVIFAIMVALLVFAGALAGVIFAFRRPLLGRIFKQTEVEMDRFASPLADVARFAAQKRVDDATDAARNLAELVLARYAWVSTRRWLVATITGLIAAMAALAGAALLLQQNQLLQEQSLLLSQQTERLTEQNDLIGQQIDLAEAQRSTSIVPAIIEIASELGEETSRLQKSTGQNYFTDADLSNDLRSRITAATLAIRPYRYLVAANPMESDFEVQAGAMLRRPELPALSDYVNRRMATYADIGVTRSGLVDRPVSPERGQILTNLHVAGILGTENLSYQGADFSFAEVRTATLNLFSLQHAMLRYADFSRVNLNQVKFGGADLSESRFRLAFLNQCDFTSIEDEDVQAPFKTEQSLGTRYTSITGADFRGAVISETGMANVLALAVDFDYALLSQVDLSGTDLAASTFRNAILDRVVLDGASLKSVDFDGAFVTDEQFLVRLSADAVADSFAADRYELVAADMEDVSILPVYDHTWLVENIDEPDFKLWQIKRVADFD